MGRIGRFLLVIGACLALLMPGVAAAQRVALVIGNGAYRGGVDRLVNPAADARGVAAALGRLGFQVSLLIDGDKARMQQELRNFGRRSEGAEIALLFYAGHGIQHGGDNWLLPVDARLQDARDVEFELVGLNSVLRQMETAQTRIVILDACRDNPLAAQLRGPGGSRSVQRGLARVERQDTGTLIAFSTAPGSVAADGAGWNSPFTEALLRHIETPGLDFQLMLRQVRRSVQQATAGAQVPWENSSLLQEVVLKPVVTVAPPAVTRPPATPPAPASSPPAAVTPAPTAPAAPTPAPRTPAEQFVLGLLAPRPAAPVPERLPGMPPHPVTPEATRPSQAAPAPAQPTPQPAALPRVPTPAGLVPFRCPPAGMRLTFDTGTRLDHHGTDPTDPTVCRTGPNSNIERLLFGYSSLPLNDERTRRAGLARIWQTPVGSSFSYTFFGGTGGGTASMFRDTVSVLRREPLMVAGQQRDTLVFSIEQEGMAGNTHLSVNTFWWDVETGAWLKRETLLIRGSTTARNYAATRIEFR